MIAMSRLRKGSSPSELRFIKAVSSRIRMDWSFSSSSWRMARPRRRMGYRMKENPFLAVNHRMVS